MDKVDLSSLSEKELIDYLVDLGEKGFHGKQIYQWLNEKLVENFSSMTNLSAGLREKLSKVCTLTEGEILEKQVAEEDGSIKYLFRFGKKIIIESVLMKYSYGNSVCISTQAGCRMGCKFCYSTKEGLERNLSPGEMLNQVYLIQKDIGERISNVVMMGSGEPLDNFENALKFIEILSSEKGIGIGQRHITLSTCGLCDKILELAQMNLKITLAVSLHGPSDDIRRKIMPVANQYGVDELFTVCRYYSEKTGRRVTYEYALMKGVNSSKEDAHQLGKKLKGCLAHINLIPVNDTGGVFLSPAKDQVQQFYAILKSYGIETTIRRKLGSSINAACGQLRGNYSLR